MNVTRIAYTVCLLIVGLGVPMSGDCQVYTLSTPISGYLTMSARDKHTNSPAGSAGTFYLTFSNLTETVYLDPVAETIRQVGVIAATATGTNFSIQETQTIPPQFPLPPSNVIGTITVSLAHTGGALLQFDTGTRPMTWNTSYGGYTFDGKVVTTWGDFVGSYSLTTGGQTFSGSFTYSLSLGSTWPAITFTTLRTAGYPDSFTLSGLGMGPQGTAFCAVSPSVVADVAADNEFHMVLSVGAWEWYGNYGEHFKWSSPGTITATLVPTTNSPTIIAQPQSVGVHAQDTASFSVTASGTLPLSYQWSLNGTNIAGATLSSLTISNVVQHDLGAYTVVVTNGVGSVTSSNATLSMYPSIVVPFAGAITYWGKDATFSVQAWGTGPLSYQWFKDGLAIENATSQEFTLTSIQSTNAGLYSVVVSSSLGSVTNPPAQVIVQPAGVSLGLYPGVTIDGVVGYNYTIRRTTDLSNTNSWVTMTNLTLAQPVQLWVDTNVDASLPANPHHFYEVLPGQ